MAATQVAQAKIDLLNEKAAHSGNAFIARRASAPGIILSDQTNDLRERLRAIMDEKKAEEENANQIINRMKSLRGDLQKTLGSCHKTLEVSSLCLAEHFKSISTKKLTAEIKTRFEHFDKDNSGSLDREEVREAMAEMGTRPTDEELEQFYVQCDADGNGLIDLVEFENMVRVKLGLLLPEDLKETVASTRAQNARFARRASTSATQDAALMRAAADAFGNSSTLGRKRRSSLCGPIESIREEPTPILPKATAGSPKDSPKSATVPARPAKKEEPITRLPSVSKAASPFSRTSSSASSADSVTSKQTRSVREPLVTRRSSGKSPEPRLSRSPEPRAPSDGFTRRSSTGVSRVSTTAKGTALRAGLPSTSPKGSTVATKAGRDSSSVLVANTVG